MEHFIRFFGVSVLSLGVGVACGGTAPSGGTGGHVNEGTGGEASGDGGIVGAGGNSGGATGTGGVTGAGGFTQCECAAIGCPPGYRSEQTPGSCCPSCVSCGLVDCAAPNCLP